MASQPYRLDGIGRIVGPNSSLIYPKINNCFQVGESQNLRQHLEAAKREVDELKERCNKLELEKGRCTKLELEKEELKRTRVVSLPNDDKRELKSEMKQDEESDGRNSTPQPDYPTSPTNGTGTLGERDMAKGEEVMVQALTISLDTFRQRYQQHPPPTNYQQHPPPTSATEGNWHLKEYNGHYTRS